MKVDLHYLGLAISLHLINYQLLWKLDLMQNTYAMQTDGYNLLSWTRRRSSIYTYLIHLQIINIKKNRNGIYRF